jgi:hypothetical protein
MLFQEIKACGYDGCYPRVTDFIWAWRQGEAISKSAFMPLQFELREAFQFDWSEEGLVVGGIYRKLQVSHMKLCASRALWLVCLSKPRARDAVRCPYALVRGLWRGWPAGAC